MPSDHIAFDQVTPLPVIDIGMYTLLAVSYIMTTIVILRALSSKKMDVISRELWNMLSIVGVPKIMEFDNSSYFVNQIIAELTKLNGIDHRTISAYNPRANGAVERTNSTIENILKKEIEGAMHEWPDFVPYIQLFFNGKASAPVWRNSFLLDVWEGAE